MSKLKLRKNRDGIKIWCRKCRQHNTGCKHYDHQNYRVNHIDPITGKHKSKILIATEYDDAVIEAINFKKGLEQQPILASDSLVGNDYDLATGIVKYQMYLNGDSEYQQFNKNLTSKYIKETIGFLVQFHDSVRENRKINWIKPPQINRADVSYFFGKMKGKYPSNKSINNIIQSLKTFFDFLIDKEDIVMKNYFKECASLPVHKKIIKTINKDDFDAILNAVDTCYPILVQNNGKKINLYHTWMKDAFRLFLLAGGRREEIIKLRWSDIFTLKNGTKFFMIGNLKASRIQKTDKEYVKYIPIGADLEKVLMDMGMEQKKHSNERIIDPTEEYSTNTMMEKITKAFTHYKKGAGVNGEITLKHLRKTYITWTNQVLGNDTGKITSHAGTKILNDHYLDPTILSAVEKAALEVRIFG
jgi:integrase